MEASGSSSSSPLGSKTETESSTDSTSSTSKAGRRRRDWILTSKFNTSNFQQYDSDTKIPLGKSFEPSPNTVVLGKGNIPKQNPGNKKLKSYALECLNEYVKGQRTEKIAIISRIIGCVQKRNRTTSTPAFVKYEKNQWWTATELDGRSKVTQVFRDCLSGHYKSSTNSKVEKRREKRKQEVVAHILRMTKRTKIDGKGP
jgi:hypothetical protein